MPTYEYECEKCGHVFEEYQSISAEPIKVCPKEECHGTVKRLFSPGAGFIFKGSGFYETDYKRKAASNGNNRPHGTKIDTTASDTPAVPIKDAAPVKKD